MLVCQVFGGGGADEEGFVESSGEVLCVGCEDLAGCLDPWRSVGVVYGLVKGGGGGRRRHGVVRFVWTLRRGLLLRNLEGLCVWVGGVLPLVPLQTSPFSFIPSPARPVPPSLFLLVLVYLVSSPPFARVVPRVTYRPAALLMNSRAFQHQQSREDGSGDAATGAVAPGRGLSR